MILMNSCVKAERVTRYRKTKNELKETSGEWFLCGYRAWGTALSHQDIEERKAEEGGCSITDDDRYAMCEIHADLVRSTT